MTRLQRTAIATALLPLLLFSAGCAREGSRKSSRAEIELGAKIFTRTQEYDRPLGANALACSNCHLDGGRQTGALSLVGAAKRYPMPGAGGSSFTLENRIARCFTHSLSGKAPDPASLEAKALVAYLTSLCAESAASPPRRSRSNAIDPANIVSIAQLNAERGRMKYDQYCSGCHGLDGQGYREKRTPLPYDYVPPVWGPRSYDNAAGLASVYTLAGFVRHAMPWDDPGQVSDLDAQEIAAFVDGQPRPDFSDKSAWDGALPSDAVYDPKQYPKNPFFVPLDQ